MLLNIRIPNSYFITLRLGFMQSKKITPLLLWIPYLKKAGSIEI